MLRTRVVQILCFLLCLLVSQGSAEIVVFGVQPATVGFGGGIPMIIHGSGLPQSPSDLTDDFNLTVNGEPCEIVDMGPTSVTCRTTPPASFLVRGPFWASELEQDANPWEIPAAIKIKRSFDALTTYFTYSYVVTPMLTAVTHVAPAGGDLSFDGLLLANDTLSIAVDLTGHDSTAVCSVALFVGSRDDPTTFRSCSLLPAQAAHYNVSVIDPTNFAGVAIPQSNLSREVFRLADDGTPYMAEVLPVLKSVTPTVISPGGGVRLTLRGNGFSTALGENAVTVGTSTECHVLTASNSELICSTAKGDPASTVVGTAGLVKKTFLGEFATLAELQQDTRYTADTPDFDAPVLEELDTSPLPKDSFSPMAATLRGLFTPPHTGNYRFFCSASDFVEVKIGADADTDPSETLCQRSGSVFRRGPLQFHDAKSGAVTATPKYLEAGKYYQFLVTYSLSTRASFYTVGMSVSSPELPRVFASVPHTIMITPPASSSPAQQYASFQITYAGKLMGIPALPRERECAEISILSKFRSFDLAKTGLKEEVLSSPCRWVIQFDDFKLASALGVQGADVTTIITGADNEWYFEALPPRMLRLRNPAAVIPVTVKVGGLPAFANSLTPFTVTPTEPAPTIASFTPRALYSTDVNFTLTGTNFDSIEPPTVYFGSPSAPCTDVQVEDSWLRCQLPRLRAGIYQVTVIFGERGQDLSIIPVVEAKYAFQTITPRSISAYGGIEVSVIGTNLPTTSTNFTITVGGVPCSIITLTALYVTCRIPPLNDTSLSDTGATPVSEDNSSVTFEVDASLIKIHPASGEVVRLVPNMTNMYLRFDRGSGPVVHSVSPTAATAALSQTLTVVGTKFTPAMTTVQLCQLNVDSCHACFIDVFSTTRIECTIGRIPPANYSVVAYTTSFGRSNLNVTYHTVLEITSILPLEASPWGSARVTIAGKGFTSDLEVKIGAVGCTPYAISWYQIECLAGAPKQTGVFSVSVAAPGAHPAACKADACQLAFVSNLKTPSIAAVFPHIGQAQRLTLTGVRFPHDASRVIVTVGEVPCKLGRYLPQSQSDRVVFYCSIVEVSPARMARISVEVLPYGKVIPARTDLFDFQLALEIDSAHPTVSSLAGGRLVTITGIGFGADTAFTVAGHPCLVSEAWNGTSVNGTHAVCVSTEASEMEDHSGTVKASSPDGQSAECCTFVYSLAGTMMVNQIIPLTVIEGSSVNITGININVSKIHGISVIGTPMLNVTGIPIGVTCIVPVVPAFRAPPLIATEFGWAKSMQGYPLTLLPRVISVSPDSSSAGGSRIVTVHGLRFSANAIRDNLDVQICGNPCEIISSNFSQIVCRTPHRITSSTLSTLPDYVAQHVKWLPLEPFLKADPVTAPAVDGNFETSAAIQDPSGRSALRLSVALKGDLMFAFFEEVQIFPTPGTESNLTGALIEISSNSINWMPVGAIGNTHSGWNRLFFPMKSTNARCLRIQAPSGATSLSIAEIRIRGVIGTVNTGMDCVIVVSLQPPTSAYVSNCVSQSLSCMQGMGVSLHYYPSSTPIIESITPRYGTTLGGTQIGFYGSGFGMDPSVIKVTLDGIPCVNVTMTVLDQMILCTTLPKTAHNSPSTVVEVANRGLAMLVASPFIYGDRWSSSLAWLGGEFPSEGSIVVIPAGVAVMLDISPPDLTAIIIQGTLRIIDTDINLRATYIIVDGGSFLAGTSTKSLMSKLTITLLGDKFSPVMPIFGSGVFGVHNGNVNLFAPRRTFRVKLFSDAAPGDMNITVRGFAYWNAGEQIVLASTTAEYTQSEEHTVDSVSPAMTGSYTTIQLREPVLYSHLGTKTFTMGATFVDMSGDVVLLTRSIVIQSETAAYENQHGGHFVAVASGTGNINVKISGVEFKKLGKRGAERRHPITILAQRTIMNSHIKECSIHHSVNRGIYVHGGHYLDISDNIVYKTVGHGIMMAGGSSLFSTISGNFVAYSMPSDYDPLPANIYITHPTVSVTKNIAAGSGFAGIWYDLQEAATDGSSNCPDRAQMGTNQGNTVYGNAQYGLIVSPRHYPTPNECLPVQTDNIVAVIDTLTAFRNKAIGAYFHNVGNYRVTGSRFFDNGRAGLSVESVLVGQFILTFSIFISQTSDYFVPHPNAEYVTAILTPSTSGFSSRNNTFVGYNLTSPVPYFMIRTCTACESDELGGFTHRFYGTVPVNSSNRIRWGPPHNELIVDEDGTLLFPTPRRSSYTAFAKYGHLSGLSNCEAANSTLNLTMEGGALAVMICPAQYSFHALHVFGVEPEAARTDGIVTTSELGSQAWQYRTPHSRPWGGGFLIILPSGTYIDANSTLQNVTALNFTMYPVADVDFLYWAGRLDVTTPLKKPPILLRFRFTGVYIRFDIFSRQERLDTDLHSMELLPLPHLEPAVHLTCTDLEEAALESSPITISAWMDLNQNLTQIQLNRTNNNVDYEMISVGAVPCHPEGCIRLKMANPIVVTYQWRDLRAWGGESLPAAGDDVLIPTGMTIILNDNTPKLRSLIIHGKLILHPRLDVTILASFIVVFGGMIEAGNEASPHSPKVTINLLNDASVGTLRVDDDVVLQPGTMAIFGHVSIVGKPKAAQWTTLNDRISSASMNSDCNCWTVKTSASIDWVQGDLVAISSSSFLMDEIDEVIVDQLSVDSRGFQTPSPIRYEHLSRLITLTDGSQQVEAAAKVAVLSRHFVIQGMTASGQVSDGCSVLFGRLGHDPEFAAHGAFMNVEVKGCGRTGTAQGAVTVNQVERQTLILKGNSIHHSLSSALVVGHSSKVELDDNVLYETVGPSLVMGDSSGNTVTNNIAFGTRFPPEFHANPALRSTPYALCSFDSRFGVNVFAGNVAAGSESEGFCIQLGACGADPVVTSENEAHSSIIGFFAAHSTVTTQTCGEMEGTRAWRNSYAGMHIAINLDVIMNECRGYDNHINFLIGREGSGNVTLNNPLIVGHSSGLETYPCVYFECATNVFDRSCTERNNQDLEDRTFLRGEIGMLMGVFLESTPHANYSRASADLPLHRPKGWARPSAHGAVYVTDPVFDFFQFGVDAQKCHGSTAVVTNEYALITTVPYFFTNVSWKGSSAFTARAYMHKPDPAWTDYKMCGTTNLCDALRHVAINDVDGSFLFDNTLDLDAVRIPGTIVSNYEAAALRDCTVDEVLNAYLCYGAQYGELQITSLDVDAQDRPFEPVKFQDQEYLARINYNYQPPDCTFGCAKKSYLRPGTVTTVLQLGQTYLVDFGLPQPRRTSWNLRSCPSTAQQAVIVRVLLPTGIDFAVWVPDELDEPVVPALQSLAYTGSIGRNYFEATDNRLYVLLRCGGTVEIHELVFAIASLELAIPVEEYVIDFRDVFVPLVASYLSFSEDRLLVVNYFPGSTIVTLKFLAKDSRTYNSTHEAADVNRYVMDLISANLTELSAALGVQVLGFVYVQWALGTPPREAPQLPSIEMSKELRWTIGIFSATAFLLLVFTIRRIRKGLLQYQDLDEKEEEDDIVKYDGGAPPEIDIGMDDEVKEFPAVEVPLSRFKIRFGEEEDEEGSEVIDNGDLDFRAPVFAAIEEDEEFP